MGSLRQQTVDICLCREVGRCFKFVLVPVYGEVAEAGSEEVLVRAVLNEPALQGGVAQLLVDRERGLELVQPPMQPRHLQPALVPGQNVLINCK